MSQQNQSFKSGLGRGYTAGLVFVPVIVPFAMLFGAVATEAGLNILETMSMSFLIIAGAAQFTALALIEDNAPTWIVLATSLAVNLRMAMYSAGLVPHFGKAPLWARALLAYGIVDQTYALADAKYGDDRQSPWQIKAGYFVGAFLAISPFWYIGTFVGAYFGAAIPPEYSLDFALPLTFIALFTPMLKTLPHWLAALASMGAALLFMSFPFGLGLLAAGFVGILVGYASEIWLEQRK